MIPAFFIHHNWDMWDILILLIVIALIFRKKIAMGLLYIILFPFALLFTILSALVGYTPKWLEEEKPKDDKPNKHRNIIF